MSGTVQTRLDLSALESGVACFGTRSPTHAVALLDVVGAEADVPETPMLTPEMLTK